MARLLQAVPDRLVYAGLSPAARRAFWVAVAISSASRVGSPQHTFQGSFTSSDSIPKSPQHQAPPDVARAIYEIDVASFNAANPSASPDGSDCDVVPLKLWGDRSLLVRSWKSVPSIYFAIYVTLHSHASLFFASM